MPAPRKTQGERMPALVRLLDTAGKHAATASDVQRPGQP
jgi:hypothetical protein